MGEIDNNTITVGNFNTQMTSIDRSSRQKINKATEVLNDTTDQWDLLDIYRTLHWKNPQYPFFSSTHVMFSRLDHILGHKTSLNQFQASFLTTV